MTSAATTHLTRDLTHWFGHTTEPASVTRAYLHRSFARAWWTVVLAIVFSMLGPLAAPADEAGSCADACDGRSCTTLCPDGIMASGFCTLSTFGIGCGCDACCFGDCDRNGEVTVNELLTMVNIVLGNTAIASCPAAAGRNGVVEVTEVMVAVNRALNGCGSPVPAPTPDPLESEYGTCYESSNCFPCEVYPCQPFSASRAFCCHLARTTGGTFSWCPAGMFDSSSGSCTGCAAPCK